MLQFIEKNLKKQFCIDFTVCIGLTLLGDQTIEFYSEMYCTYD